jgi:hypothetical protein
MLVIFGPQAREQYRQAKYQQAMEGKCEQASVGMERFLIFGF